MMTLVKEDQERKVENLIPKPHSYSTRWSLGMRIINKLLLKMILI